MNAAIIGIGRWGKVLLKNIAKHYPGLHITHYMHGGDSINSEWMIKNHPSAKRAENYDEILENSSIKAIFIATPIRTHHEFALKASRRGKHVLVEKPLLPDSHVSARDFLKARHPESVVLVGYTFIYSKEIKHAQRILACESPLEAHFTWSKFGTFGENIIDNLLSHDVASAIHLFGPIQAINTVIADRDFIYMEAYFGECKCTFSVNRASKNRTKTLDLLTKINFSRLDFEKGYIYIDNLEVPIPGSKTPIENELDEFINSIANRRDPLTSIEFDRQVTASLESIKDSLQLVNRKSG